MTKIVSRLPRIALGIAVALAGCSVDIPLNINTTDNGYTAISGSAAGPRWSLGSNTNGDTVYRLDTAGASELKQFPGEYLSALAFNASGDVWVAGSMLHHYNGTTWNVVMMPSDPIRLAGPGWAIGKAGTLYGFAGESVTTLAAPIDGAGDLIGGWSDGVGNAWALDYDHVWRVAAGGAWTDVTPTVTLPAGHHHVFEAVTATSSGDVWVAEYSSLMLHFDGATWATVPVAEPVLLVSSMFSRTATDVWATLDADHLLHFDGTRWARVALPPQNHCSLDSETIVACTDLALYSVWAGGAKDVWVGGYLEGDPGGWALLFHYDGASWQDFSEGAN